MIEILKWCSLYREANMLSENEPRALGLAGELYGLGHAATPAEMQELSEQWRPFRTWAVVLLRAAGARLGDGE